MPGLPNISGGIEKQPTWPYPTALALPGTSKVIG